jgi:chemotaxis protein methyltransferase CheR
MMSKEVIDTFEFEHVFARMGRRTMLLNAEHVANARNSDAALLVAFEDITVRRQTEKLRDELIRQKETLLLEIQHRVANSLQIIASILMLKIGSVKSDETRLHLKDAHQRVMAVATVQEQLRQSVLGDKIEIGPYLLRLCSSLAMSMIPEERGLVLSASSSGGSVKSSEAVSFGLLVTELVINAIKHAFPGGRTGRIDVAFTGEADAWQLSVSDDGVGREVRPGKEHVGLGTSIVQALAQQLNARVEISDNSPGTKVTIVPA